MCKITQNSTRQIYELLRLKFVEFYLFFNLDLMLITFL